MPSKEVVEKNTHEFEHIFAASTDVLMRFLNANQIGVSESALNLESDVRHRQKLFHTLRYNLRQAEGYFEEYVALCQEGAHEIARNKPMAAVEPRLVLTLIYANATQKANRGRQGKLRNREVEHAADNAVKRALALSSQILLPDRRSIIEELDQHLTVAKAHNWQRRDGDTRLLQIIGATWCPDTAVSVVKVAAAYELPVHFLNMWREDEILESDAAQDENEKGFIKHLDHAYVSLRPDATQSRLPVPVVIFPDRSVVTEPSPAYFVIELVKHGLL
jgi:hypothetical protein